jgi:hypothetical protein
VLGRSLAAEAGSAPKWAISWRRPRTWSRSAPLAECSAKALEPGVPEDNETTPMHSFTGRFGLPIRGAHRIFFLQPR